MMKKKLVPLLLLLLLGSLIAYVEFNQSRLTSPKPVVRCIDCNVVLIIVDTLRADHLSSFGYTKQTSPTIDEWARRGTVFTNTISAAPWTLPSIMSMMTGMYPSRHGVINKSVIIDGQEQPAQLVSLSPQLKTLAEMLKQNGYATAAFTGGAGVDHEFGFDTGFDVYQDELNFGGFEQTISPALNWLQQQLQQKKFLLLHGYDVHGQFVPAGGYDRRFVDFAYQGQLTGSKDEQLQLREEGVKTGRVFLTPEDVNFLTALYDEKVNRADQQLAHFFADSASMLPINNTIFVIISDHGEELYEHQRIDHGHSLYEELIKVPFMVVAPQLKPDQKISTQVRTIDMMPTVLDLLAINYAELPYRLDGKSLVPLLEGRQLTLDALSETDYRYATAKRSLRTTDSWKLIIDLDTEQQELYDLNQDPGETTNLAGKKLDRLSALQRLLLPFFAANSDQK